MFSWDIQPQPVEVWLWGERLTITEELGYSYPGGSFVSDAPPPIEVVPLETHPSYFTHAPIKVLQWYRVACHHYQIEVWSGGQWLDQGIIHNDLSPHIVSFTTPLLADDTQHQWRVTAVGENMRTSDPLEYAFKVVRNPNPPTLPKLTCSGGLITVE